MLIFEYHDTLVPGRKRDRLMTRLFAGIGRLLGMSTDP